MRTNQQTLKTHLTFSGIGLHTGKSSTIIIEPATTGFGIRFQRTDIEDAPVIKADVDFVLDTSRGTTLGIDQVKIHTVEHLLAALFGCGVDNALIKINGEEVPILDGSAWHFVKEIIDAGVIEQDAPKQYFSIDENIHFVDDDKQVDILAVPAKEFKVTTLIDFKSNVLGTQHAVMNTLDEFNNQISNCRTFCFLHEIQTLIDNNLIKGGDLDNAIVIVDRPIEQDELDKLSVLFNKKDIIVDKEGILNNLKLHYPNEPARHKLLDVIGDLSLCGYSINAHIIANRPGHSSNVAFAKKIKAYIKENKHLIDVPVYDPTIPPIYDINHIYNVLPHKYPFLLVDKIIEMSPESVVGIKNVTFNEQFFQGHFPNNPVMPGVLIIEAMAQVGGILALNNFNDGEKYDTYFLKIDKVKFKMKVIPGDTLVLKLELMRPIRRGICEMRGVAYVGNKVATEAELVAQITPRQKQ